jgi:predicted flap endonuclease-1-like 5' DNA nuclease
MVKNTQQEILESSSANETVRKAGASFVTYNKNRPVLDFESFAYTHKRNKNDLTRIEDVGSYIEEKRNEIGNYNFDQISKLNESYRFLPRKNGSRRPCGSSGSTYGSLNY